VKQVIRSTTVDDCARLARQVMQQSDAKLIREMVTGFGRKADG
jgi:phosphotransferase system enzyme I (PtsI)